MLVRMAPYVIEWLSGCCDFQERRNYVRKGAAAIAAEFQTKATASAAVFAAGRPYGKAIITLPTADVLEGRACH